MPLFKCVYTRQEYQSILNKLKKNKIGDNHQHNLIKIETILTNNEDCDSKNKDIREMMMMKKGKMVVEEAVSLVLLLPHQSLNIQIIQDSNILNMFC